MSLKVYLAGASAEVFLAAQWMHVLRHAGVEITYDWAAAEVRDPRRDADFSVPERQRIAAQCLAGVRAADVVWAMVPKSGLVTRGLYCELGYALAVCRPFIISSDDSRCLFTSLARATFTTPDAAASYLIEAHRRHQDGFLISQTVIL